MITELITYKTQLQIWHWQTNKYSQHMAFQNTYETLEELIDSFVESFSGKYGKIKSESNFVITLKNIDDKIVDVIDSHIKWLLTDLPAKLNTEEDVDLLNIRDEMVAALTKLKYLLTLD